jgi:hypothetical protein
MSTSPERDGSRAAEAPGAADGDRPIALELSLSSGDPVSGTVGLPGRPPTPFQGWIDLMSAINSLWETGQGLICP